MRILRRDRQGFQRLSLEMMGANPHHIICFEIVNCIDCQHVQLFEFPSIFVNHIDWENPSVVISPDSPDPRKVFFSLQHSK